MTRYLSSFPEGAMTFPDEDLPDVSAASHAVVRAAKAAGVWVFGGGLLDHDEATTVATDGMVSDGPYPGTMSYRQGHPGLLDEDQPGEAKNRHHIHRPESTATSGRC